MSRSLRTASLRATLGLVLVLLLLGHTVGLYTLRPVAVLERWCYDLRVQWLGASSNATVPVSIVAIDDASLNAAGSPPWSGEQHAELLEQLFNHYGVRAVALATPIAGGTIADERRQIIQIDAVAANVAADAQTTLQWRTLVSDTLAQRTALATVTAGQSVAVGYRLIEASGSHVTSPNAHPNSTARAALLRPSMTAAALIDERRQIRHWHADPSHTPTVAALATARGFVNLPADDDGIVRRVPLLAIVDDMIVESLAFALVRASYRMAPIAPRMSQGGPFSASRDAGLDAMFVGPLRISVSDRAETLIPYRLRGAPIPVVSANDVRSGALRREQLAGHAVLVGVTAGGYQNLVFKPGGGAVADVQVHAEIAAGILNGTLKESPEWLSALEAALLVALGSAVAIAFARLPLGAIAAATAVALLGVITMAVAAWNIGRVVLPIAALLTVVAVLALINAGLHFWFDLRPRQRLQQLFAGALPPAAIERLARDPHATLSAPSNVELTVMFADLRGFTTASERMDPASLRRFLGEYLTELSQVIQDHHGTVDKYIGDSIMAFWGAPLADTEHARHAIMAAAAMHQAATRVQSRLASEGGPALELGIGVNTGLMSVGEMGSQMRRSYTVLGDAVNLASRLESLTKYYGVTTLIGEPTRRLVPELACRELDRVRVKGRDEAVAVYEPFEAVVGFGADQAADTKPVEALRLWNHMLHCYRASDWDGAEAALLKMQRFDANRTLYELYLSRIVRYRSVPPPSNWNGVTVFDRK